MSDLRKIKEKAEKDFPAFLEYQIENNPDLLIKYGLIDLSMKGDFVEGVLLQFWENKDFDHKAILEFMVNRRKSMRRQL